MVVALLAEVIEMESIVGLVLVTLTEALSWTVSPSASIAEPVHVMMSAGEAVLGVRVSEAVAPRDVFCVSFVQA